MDKQTEAQQKVEHLSQLLNHHQHLYYVEMKPVVSDSEYDNLFDQLLELEEKYPELKKEDSPTQRIGSDLDSSFEEVSHTMAVLSLDKAYTTSAVNEWMEKSSAKSKTNLSFTVEEKMDGVALVLYYEKGILKRGVTRGNGYVGNDVTANAKTVKSIPLKLKEAVDVAVRGEIFITKDDFETLNEKQQGLYANSRNLASGALRRLKSSETAAFPLKMFVYDAYFEDKRENSLTHLQLLSFLVDLGFAVNPSLALFSESGEELPSSIKGVKFGLLNQMAPYIEKKGEQRATLPYEIDGLVIKVNEIEIRTLLGSTSHHPRWALAYKFEAPEAQSVVNSIDVQIGRTGRVTPVARIESVRVGNSVVSNVTLHNQAYIDMLELAIGDKVAVSKRGDVIPAIERVVDKNEQGNSTWKMDSNCPVCQTLLVEVGAHTFCPNEKCPQQVLGSLIFFAGKNQMDIEGFGSETVTYLYENNLVKEISDLYKVDYDVLIGKIGFQKKKVDSLKRGIAKSKEQPFRKVLVSLGIEDFGKNGVDLIVDNGITTIDKLLELVDNDNREKFLAIKGLGEKTVDSLFKALKKESMRLVIEKLKEFGLQMEEEVKEVDTALPFAGQIWCVTGSFEAFSPRSLAEKEIEKRGGKVTSSLSKNTTFLLAGEKAGSKLQQAIKLGTTIVDEKQFIEMVEALN
jgi:DNA ligase (NAD+)